MLGMVPLAVFSYRIVVLLFCALCLWGNNPAFSAETSSPVPSVSPSTASSRTQLPKEVFVVPNFHPASCGWLANWSVERNYCANSYLNHLDRVRDDTNYGFVFSECNNMIALQNFKPDRFDELKERVKQGRVELVNAFFLEPTINLSGGESLAKMGIEGLRWQEQMMGVRPRFCWAVDTCGVHAQMPQICSLLGLDGLVYTRKNPAGKTIFWSESPDGSRIVTFVPGHYSEDLGGSYGAKNPLSPSDLVKVEKVISKKIASTPRGAPVLFLGGSGDYALPPAKKENPSEFLHSWKQYRPDCDLHFGTFSQYADAVLPAVKLGKVEIPTVRGGTQYDFDSFWIENPRVKEWYRRDEHALVSAEMLSTIASLKGNYQYPVNPLHLAWLQMLLNMDRNTLWGSAGGMVFESNTSWDVMDRFKWVANASKEALEASARTLLSMGSGLSLFNSLNWERRDPVRLKLPENKILQGVTCQAVGDGTVLCQMPLPSIGIEGSALSSQNPTTPKTIELPQMIQTPFYSIRIDPLSGALVSLKTKAGHELLGGPANVIVAEKYSFSGRGDPGDYVDARPKRKRLANSGDFKTSLTVTEGPIAMTVDERGKFFGGGDLHRIIRFYKNSPRIDFETELNDIPDRTVVVSEFPLAEKPEELRRGIPFGFADDNGISSAILPAIGWSDYSVAGKGGLAILDHGATPGRELDGKVPVLYLLNATDKYYGYENSWLSGKGSHHFEYALLPHDEDWMGARIPQQAREYNSPVAIATDCAASAAQSFVKTSPNLIVEAMRRDGTEVELRMVEALGQSGEGEVTVNLPITVAQLSDLTGKKLGKLEGGPSYRFPVRPQQIITLRFRTEKTVAETKPLLDWSPLVPESKQKALHRYIPDAIGHPPRGD